MALDSVRLRNPRDIVEDAPRVTDFGAVAEYSLASLEVDNQVSLQLAIDACEETGTALTFPSGLYRCDGPLYIRERAVWRGAGKFNAFTNADRKGSGIVFTHDEPACIIVENGATTHFSHFSDMGFSTTSTVANQHCFLRKPLSDMSSGGFSRVAFANFTGACLYYETAAGVAAYDQNIAFRDVSTYQAGAFIGCDDVPLGLIATGVTIDNFNSSSGVNLTSQQPAFFDLRYMRGIAARQVVTEGAHSCAILVRLGGNTSTRIEGFHAEFTTTKPDYLFDVIAPAYDSGGGGRRGEIIIDALYNAHFNERVIRLSGTGSYVRLRDWNTVLVNATDLVVSDIGYGNTVELDGYGGKKRALVTYAT